MVDIMYRDRRRRSKIVVTIRGTPNERKGIVL